MTGHGEKLTRKMETAIAALLVAPSIEVAAQAVGIGEKTLRRWIKFPAFQTAYMAARREVMQNAILKAQQAANEAVDTLKSNLKCEKPEASNQAAKIILDVCFRGSEVMDIMARLEILEGQQHEPGDDQDETGAAGADATDAHDQDEPSADVPAT